MRLPRVRLTVGMLLFGVALVAVNFAGFRRFYETHIYTGGMVGYRLLPAGIGIIPLFNVALIGTWLFAAKQLDRHRLGRATNPRLSLSGVTYFSLQFLLLGGVISLFMPVAIPMVQEIADAATGYAAKSWGAVFGQEPGGAVPWLILDSSILAVLISGPLLLLSWIGQVLAARYAATLPRRRFRAVACLVSLGFASVALTICLTPQPFEDEQEVVLDLQVVDEVTGRAINAAFICITNPFSYDSDPLPPRALTDRGGRARLVDRFVVQGDRNAFTSMGVFSPWGRWLEVSAANHRTRHIPLTEILGSFADPSRPGVSKVRLFPGANFEDSFRGIAGHYSIGNGFGGRWIDIEPDGRFAWSDWGCTHRVGEYGHLKQSQGELTFVLVGHPGRESHPDVNAKYRVVEWGDCLYLSLADTRVLREFCRRALTPDRPSGLDHMYQILPREPDRDSPPLGLPRLPAKVWGEFLIDEMRLRNKERALGFTLSFRLARQFGRAAFRMWLSVPPRGIETNSFVRIP